MTDCNELISIDDQKNAKIDADSIGEFVNSMNNTFQPRIGDPKRTIEGVINYAEGVVSSLGYVIVGDFADSPKVELTNPNQLYTSKSVVNAEDAIWRYTGALPYTPTESEPTTNWVSVAQGELKSAALAAGTTYDNITYSTNLVDEIKGYIFDATKQVTYAVQEAAQGKFISSVVNGVLTTTDTSEYKMYKASDIKIMNVADSVGVALKQKWLDTGISVRDFAINGVLNSEAINKTVSYVKSGAVASNLEFANAIVFPAGDYDIDRPVWIYQMDGIEFKGSGKFTTRFNITEDFEVGSLPAEFLVINNAYRDYSYTTQKAVFIIAARRVTGGADGDINESGANAAAWHLNFSGMSFHGNKLNAKSVAAFYAPEIGLSVFKDLYCQYVTTGFLCSDIYRTTIENYTIENSITPFTHFSTASHSASGTTLNLVNSGGSRVSNGWKFSGLLYSAFSNTSVDVWGYDQSESSTKYAYEFNDCVITLKGCGAESGEEGKLNPNCGLIKTSGISQITHDACQYFGAFDVADINVCKFSDSSSNEFRGGHLNMGANGEAGTALLTESARVRHSLLFGKSLASEMFNVQSTNCSVIATDPNQQQKLTFTAENYSVPAGSVPISLPHTIQTSPQLMSFTDGSGFKVKMTGVFSIRWDFVISGNNWQYILLTKNGSTLKQITFENVLNKRYAESIALEVGLTIGDEIRWSIRGGNGDATGVLNHSNIEVNRIR